jgi:dipeptidase D
MRTIRSVRTLTVSPGTTEEDEMTLANLEPGHVWKHFDKIRAIPRPSGHEEQIRKHLLAFATEQKLQTSADTAGNVVIRVPATRGHEKAPTVVLQGHMDMVCEKNKDVQFDFMKDPIQLVVEGEWLKAKGTTLGSDNGVGLAAALALVDDGDAVHGPLEILATVDEETGLTGASDLDGAMLKGKTLINLDTEEIGAVYIGCAGGGGSTITLPVKTKPVPDGREVIQVKITGLRGGHSGVDIHEQRGNAIKALARILWKVSRKYTLTLVDFSGGGVHNAIPREASATCVVAASALNRVKKAIDEEARVIKTEWAAVDPGFKLEVMPAKPHPAEMMAKRSHVAVLHLLLALPHGVERMSSDVPGLVETSTNLATVGTKDRQIVIGTSTRSSVASALQALRDRIRAASELAGAKVEEGKTYPGWKPNLESKVLEVTKRTHERVFGKAPKLKAIHAGLECGIIGEKVPGMDMVSIGPQIEWPHSPDERVNIPSVKQFYTLLKAVLKELA